MKNRAKYIVITLCSILVVSGLNAQSLQSELQDIKTQLGLEPQENLGSEVAYGTQKKENLSASTYTISGEELLQSRSSNLLIALQGKLPGLQILQIDGEPGKESFDVKVRGVDSPTNNGVLFIVDGIQRQPDGIDPNEVESVTVLRDGAATAMYGMRGSGGAILIKTKRGINGESKINISVDHSLQAPTYLPKYVSAYDYVKMYNQRLDNDILSAAAQGSPMTGVHYTDEEIEHYRTGDNQEFYPTRNMVDEFMKDYSQMTRANINFQGGSNIMRYFTSVSFTQQGGLFENEPFDVYSYDAESKSSRVNFRSNMDITLTESLEAWVNIGGFISRANRPYIGSNQGWDYVIAKLYDTPNNAHNDLTPDGEVLVKKDKISFRPQQSVYGYLNRTGSQNDIETRVGNTFGARQSLDNITKGLSVSAQVAFDVFSRNTQLRYRDYEAWEVVSLAGAGGLDSLGYQVVPGTKNSNLDDGSGKFFNYMYNVRASVDYERTFGAKHRVSAMLMGERQMQQQQRLLASNYIGINGRANYGYDNKYLAEVNFAYQGSEQFAPGKRFGLFPSLSLGWVASNEGFLQDSEVLSFLKLRASIGQNGNSVYNYGNDNQYLYVTTWNPNASENQIGNENVTWETYTKSNIGVEAELFNSLNLSLDLFYNKNTDLMVNDIANLPNLMGLNNIALPPANLGAGTNKGFEVAIGYVKQFNDDFGIALNGQLSYATNKLGAMAEMPYDVPEYAYAYHKQGYAIGQSWGYKTDGLFNDQAEIDNWFDQTALGGTPIPGDIKYKDITGDGVVDERDKAPLGVLNRPEYVYGFSAQLNYKGFDLAAFFSGMANRQVYLQSFGRQSKYENFTEYMRDNTWTSANPSSDAYPRLDSRTNSPNYILSDYWIKDGSFLRLRNVELGYTLPKTLTDRIEVGSIRLYVNALNPISWHNLPNNDFDPETSNSGNINYPIIKALNVGLNVKF